jgi:hypothetical protein
VVVEFERGGTKEACYRWLWNLKEGGLTKEACF